MDPIAFSPAHTYIQLSNQGNATALAGGVQFWEDQQKLEEIGRDWLISEYNFDQDWPNWEMHPHADEFVYLLEGEAIIYLEEKPTLVRQINLKNQGAIVIPKGLWHTAKIIRPCRMLHVTMGAGTESRPA